MSKSSLTVSLVGIYAFIVMFAIFLYALIEELGLDVALATNLLIWSATLFAPTAVYYGFRSWKVQRFEEHKIKAITEIKERLLRFNEIVLKYRMYGNNYHLIENKMVEFDKNEKDFLAATEELRFEIRLIIDKNSIYFDKPSCEGLYQHNDKLVSIMVKLEDSASCVSSCWLGSATLVDEEDADEDQNTKLLKRIYLIDLQPLILKPQFYHNTELKNKCVEYERIHIIKPARDFSKFLDDILLKSYHF